MASDRARQVARDVIKNLRKPQMTKGKIIRATGYKKSVSESPTVVTKTKSYQEEMRPFLARMIALRDKVEAEMQIRDISKERFTELAVALKGFNHDIQLISGGVTERQALELTFDEAFKNETSPSAVSNS